MPGYTHLQRAEPVLLAHWLLAYVSMLERDLSRFADARTRMNFCPLGSGAIAGATLAARPHHRQPTPSASPRPPPTAWTPPPTATSCSTSPKPPAPSASTSLASPKSSPSTPPPSSASSTYPKPSPPAAPPCRKRKTPTSPSSPAAKPPASSAPPQPSAPSSKASRSPTTRTCRKARSRSSTSPTPSPASSRVLPTFTRALKFRTPQLARAAQHGYLNAMAAATYLSQQRHPLPQGSRDHRQRRSPRPRLQSRTQRPYPRGAPQLIPGVRIRYLRGPHPTSDTRLPRRPGRHRSPPGRPSPPCSPRTAGRGKQARGGAP